MPATSAIIARVEQANVLAVSQSAALGGAELALLRIAERLPEHGFQVEIAVPTDGPMRDAARAQGLRVHRLPVGRLRPGGWPRAVLAWPRTRALVKQLDPDLVWLNGGVTQRLAPAMGNALLVPHLHDLPHFQARPWRSQRFWDRTPIVMCDSDAVAGLAAKFGVPRERLRTVYVPVESVDAGPRPAWLGDGPAIGFVGRIEERKGVIDLVRAVPHLRPDASVVIIGGGAITGNGRYEEQVRTEAAKLGGRVMFAGPAPDARALLPWLTVLAVPSHEEPFGTAAAEALAAGTPVVGTTTGGIGEYLEPGQTGELVPPADPPALAEALNAVIERAPEMEDACRAAAERFSTERVAVGVAAAFREALASARAG
jgi:glycosyltransferase involved in cell wall biosynthesis